MASKFSLLNSHATNGGDIVLQALIEAAGVMTDTKVKRGNSKRHNSLCEIILEIYKRVEIYLRERNTGREKIEKNYPERGGLIF